MIDGKRLSDKSLNFVAAGERVRPLRSQILIKPLPQMLGDKVNAEWQGETVTGTVIAVGPGRRPNIHKRGMRDGKPFRNVRESEYFRATEVKVGDVVHLGGMEIGGYLFPHVFVEDENAWCVLCDEQDVAVVKES